MILQIILQNSPPHTHTQVVLFSVSKEDTENLRVNIRKCVIYSAEVGFSETAEMEHYAPQTGTWGLVVWGLLLLLPVDPPSFHFPTGTWPNITRNAIVNCAEMVTYDIIKEKLLDHHLFTGEALGSKQTALPQQRGNLELHIVSTTQRQPGFRTSRERST